MSATERISLRATPHAKAVIEEASRLMGVSVSHYILTTMYEKSLNLVNESKKYTWQASTKDSQVLMDLSKNPRTPNNELKALLALSDDLVDET